MPPGHDTALRELNMIATPRPVTRVIYVSEDFRTTIIGETSDGPPVVRYSKIHRMPIGKSAPNDARIVHYQSPENYGTGGNSAWVAQVFYLLLEIERLNKQMERQMAEGNFEEDVYIKSYKETRKKLEILCGKNGES
jgi:hypothetical protein